MNQEYKKIIEATQSGGAILKKYFGQNLEIEEKTMASDFRTKADQESEIAILEVLNKHFPDYNIHAEESGVDDKKSDYTFVIDPLDGTNNFVLGIPYFSSTISLLKGDETIFAVIYNPILDQLYWAEKGAGAFCNEKKINVNNEDSIKKTSAVYTCSYALSESDSSKDIMNKLMYRLKVKRTLTNWCPTLDYCLLASGRIEAIINNNDEIYDYIAGKLICKEAGAKITDFKDNLDNNDKNGFFLASNGTKIHDTLLKII